MLRIIVVLFLVLASFSANAGVDISAFERLNAKITCIANNGGMYSRHAKEVCIDKSGTVQKTVAKKNSHSHNVKGAYQKKAKVIVKIGTRRSIVLPVVPETKKVHLHYKKTGKSVVVRINDTGGFAKYHRDIDLDFMARRYSTDMLSLWLAIHCPATQKCTCIIRKGVLADVGLSKGIVYSYILSDGREMLDILNRARIGTRRSIVLPVVPETKKVVRASWYGPGFHGNATKCREIFNQYALTAASNTLACNTKVRLHYKKTGKSVVVRINDTGGFAKYHRDIDLSLQAAKVLNMKDDGHASLEMQIVFLPKRKFKIGLL